MVRTIKRTKRNKKKNRGKKEIKASADFFLLQKKFKKALRQSVNRHSKQGGIHVDRTSAVDQ